MWKKSSVRRAEQFEVAFYDTPCSAMGDRTILSRWDTGEVRTPLLVCGKKKVSVPFWFVNYTSMTSSQDRLGLFIVRVERCFWLGWLYWKWMRTSFNRLLCFGFFVGCEKMSSSQSVNGNNISASEQIKSEKFVPFVQHPVWAFVRSIKRGAGSVVLDKDVCAGLECFFDVRTWCAMMVRGRSSQGWHKLAKLSAVFGSRGLGRGLKELPW